MATFQVPAYVRAVLERLCGAGYASYLVGGCVRDIYLHRRPKDWDICTAARPEAVLALFPRAVPTGLRHGTVTVVQPRGCVEVTTFRAESRYSDHRHPDAVVFVPNLEEDLARRDFTVNAMALTKDFTLIDIFGGLVDLEKKCLRCVGNPTRRFEEDALRMLRALRFSAVLRFQLHPTAYAAILEKASLTAHLASERIQAELGKILLSGQPSYALEALHLGLLPPALRGTEDLPGPELRFPRLPRERNLRWSAFCAILARAESIDDARAFLTRLRLDRHTLEDSAVGASLAQSASPQSDIDWKRLIAREGVAAARSCAAAMTALYGGTPLRTLRRILSSGACCSVGQLAISGKDLRSLGFHGPAIGAQLRQLLEHVFSHPEDNNREALLSISADQAAHAYIVDRANPNT